jgi:predicted nucleic acid-binding protein
MGQIISFDTNTFIYFLDKDSPFFTQSAAAIQLLETPGITGFASVLVVTELRAGMTGLKDIALLDDLSSKLRLLDTDRATANRAGALRQQFPSLRTPDAIHIATAQEAGATHFFTNDSALANLSLPLKIVLLSEFDGILA